MLLAFEAILGHKSAHSFATGPATVDPMNNKLQLSGCGLIIVPFISPLALTITPALSSEKIPSGLTHFSTHTLKIKKDAILSSVWLSLSYNYSWHYC